MNIENNSDDNHSDINERPSLWNPNAAVNWSLLLTPVFGSCIHYLNWKALGNEKNIKYSLFWFVISIILLLFLTFTPAESGIGLLLFIYLFIWYFFAGRKQCKYVKTNFCNNYTKKSWKQPLLVSFIVLIAFIYFSV